MDGLRLIRYLRTDALVGGPLKPPLLMMRKLSAAILVGGLCGCPAANVPDAGLPGGGCAAPCGKGLVCKTDRCVPDRCGGVSGVSCATGLVCLDHYCSDLSCDPQCPAAQTCSTQTCIPALPPACQTSADCDTGESCVGGFCSQTGCTPACPSNDACLDALCILPLSGQTACARPYQPCQNGDGPYCANLLMDSTNCGACGTTCPTGEICNGSGVCSVTCIASESKCPGAGSSLCVNLQSDNENCGQCGQACPSGQSCSAGGCAATCAVPFASCGPATAIYCADLASDPSNCGGCGQACTPGGSCLDGGCAVSCPAPFALCPSGSGYSCVDPSFDLENCGGCGQTCGGQSVCFNGRCAPCGGPLQLCCPPGLCETRGLDCVAGVCMGSVSSSGGGSSGGSSTGGTSSGGSSSGTLSLLAGSQGVGGTTDGTGTAARFDNPYGMASDGHGNVYVADQGGETIRQVVLATGVVITLAGAPGVSGSANGTGAAASFYAPEGLATDTAGNLYVSDTGNHTIRQLVLATGAVTTLAGSPGVGGSNDGTGAAARFSAPNGLACDGAGNLYVADSSTATVRKLVLATGVVTTFAGAPGITGSNDGTGAAALFNTPNGLATDGAGNLYLADACTIRKLVLATAEVTTIAGSPNVCGNADGTGFAARFANPNGLASDGAGHLYVADTGNLTVRKLVLATASVITLAGVAGEANVALGPLPGGLDYPIGVAAGPTPTVIISDGKDMVILEAN